MRHVHASISLGLLTPRGRMAYQLVTLHPDFSRACYIILTKLVGRNAVFLHG